MKCTEVEKLLPLYAGNDLADERRARALSEHLQACAECRRMAEEFSASLELLQGQPAPDFDDAFYQNIRADVLRDIRNLPAPRPSLFESLRLLLMQRPAFAATLAVLMVFVALFVVVRRNSTGQSAHLVSVESGFGEINPHELRERDESADVSNINAPTVTKTIKRNVQRPQQAASLADMRRKKQSVEEEGTRPEDSANVVRKEPAPSVTPDVPQNDSATVGAAQPAQAIARMEIQTSDPNIRIIWLSRKPSE